MYEKNKDIRLAFKEAGLKHWQVAYALGISEATMVRRLRQELPKEEKSHILQTVEKLKDQAVKEVV